MYLNNICRNRLFVIATFRIFNINNILWKWDF